jgi:exonuclease VII large subunit
MENKVLLYLSLASSVTGLVILYAASLQIGLSTSLAGDITYDDVGKNAKVCGVITSAFTSKTGHVFLTLKDHSGEIELVVFNSTVDELQADNLKKNDRICVSGKIDEYENKLEIIPKEIERMA